MQTFDQQLQRIRQKLIQAKRVDTEFSVFGASGHKYILLDPVAEEEIIKFEKNYAVELPQCYRSFISKIGNGGINNMRSGAGPYFGIFPLGEKVNYLIYKPEIYLRNTCQLFPDMSDEYWDKLTERVCADDPISDEEYETEIGKVFGGILPLGLQGCSFLHGLIINGAYTGRVVNLDVSLSKPVFTREKNFLDWYERWLNEIISGYLRKNGTAWFGFDAESA